jgi:hypothetical protein
MLINDTVNLLTLCLAVSLACQSCGYHAKVFSVACVAIVLSLATLWLPHLRTWLFDLAVAQCLGVLSKQAEVTGTGGVEFYREITGRSRNRHRDWAHRT